MIISNTHNLCDATSTGLHPGYCRDLGWLFIMAAIVRLSSVCRRGIKRE